MQLDRPTVGSLKIIIFWPHPLSLSPVFCTVQNFSTSFNSLSILSSFCPQCLYKCSFFFALSEHFLSTPTTLNFLQLKFRVLLWRLFTLHLSHTISLIFLQAAVFAFLFTLIMATLKVRDMHVKYLACKKGYIYIFIYVTQY